MSNIRLFVLLAALTLFFLLLGDFIAKHAGIFVGLFVAILMIARAYFYSDKSILVIFDAKAAAAGDVATMQLEATAKMLADKANIPVPTLYVITSDAANICAIGRNPACAALVVTTGLMQALNPSELTAVIAQKISDIVAQNTFLMTVGASLPDTLLQLADSAVWYSMIGDKRPSKVNETALKLLAPIASILVRCTVPKGIQFETDRLGAQLCGDPKALASALTKLDALKQHTPFVTADARPTTANLFIVNPLSDVRWTAMFSRQPEISERIKQLETMA